MRVLIVLASNARRGAEVEGSQLAAELRRGGHEAQAVALVGGATNPLDVTVLGARPLAPGTLRALRRRARSFDVVIAYGSTALPACALALAGARTPFVYRSIGDPARWVRGGLHRRRTGLLFRRAAHVVALWPQAAASIGSLYIVRADRLSCIANARPAPGALPDRAEARAALGLPVDALVVAWAGALSEEKCPLTAVEAVEAVPGAWLAMAGAGPLQLDVEAACLARLPGRHRLLGVLDPLAPLWAAADVVLLTSVTEGMPGVLIEAALCGVPAVATDVGAVAEMVTDGVSGRLLRADGDVAALAAAITDVAARRAEFGAAATVWASRFTWDEVLPAWSEVLDRVKPVRRP